MRPLALLACASVLLLPGCVSSLGGVLADGDCRSDIKQAVSTDGEVLYPSFATGGASPANNPSITVTARPGQTVIAQAVWQVSAGEARHTYDGPDRVTVGTEGTWQRVSHNASGKVTLGLQGDPIAYGVTYILQLSATGCT